MMTQNVVWKYPLTDEVQQDVVMPWGAKIVACAMQGETLTLWAMVDPSAVLETHKISIVSTGAEFEADEIGEYVGTFQDGGAVGHVFDWRTSGEKK